MSKSSFILERENERPILIDYSTPEEDTKGVILFAHGFKGYKDWGDWNLVQSFFMENGFVFVKFNFSCNGGTMENPIDFPDLEAFSQNSYWQEQIDIKDVIDWVSEKFGFEIHLIGHSRGGAAVLLQSDNHLVKSITSWAGVTDVFTRLKPEEVACWEKGETVMIKNGRTNQNMPLTSTFYNDLIEHKGELNIEKKVKGSTKSILAIHAIDDLAVSYVESKNLIKWNSNVDLHILSTGGHTFETKQPSLNNEIKGSLKEVVKITKDWIQDLSN